MITCTGNFTTASTGAACDGRARHAAGLTVRIKTAPEAADGQFQAGTPRRQCR